MSFHTYMVVQSLILFNTINSISYPYFLTNKVKVDYYKLNYITSNNALCITNKITNYKPIFALIFKLMLPKNLQWLIINSKLIFLLIFVQICIQNNLILFINYYYNFLKKIWARLVWLQPHLASHRSAPGLNTLNILWI
jgi:hypothetical protein